MPITMNALQNLINNISPSSISNFFKSKISSFKPIKEEFELKSEWRGTFLNPVKVGEVTFSDSDELLIFCCKSNQSLTERSSKKIQFEIAKSLLKEDFKDGAIFVFYDDAGNFRFSFLRKHHGSLDNKYSTWKRYTYFVEPLKQNKTFKIRIDTCQFSDLDKIQDAFSVEKLTKQFYDELFKWYQWTLSEEVGVTFPNNTDIAEDDRVQLEEQIIRLITRILFVWFIKQKDLVPSQLFDIDEIDKVLENFDPKSVNEGNYYNAILQNLFFATLNKSIEERGFAKIVSDRDIKTLYRYSEMFSISETEILNLFKAVPFLNGGLFECLDKTLKQNGVKYALDGFSRNATKSTNGNFKHRAFIPNCVFFDEQKGIIPLLERYNFTVEENAPNEIQVALDPELLGNVFENLLGAFNPETKETARKQSGSFYTPREIVSYMVDESLIYYLIDAFPNVLEKDIRSLFTEDSIASEFASNKVLCANITHKLKEIKILDPACGSGAFPMGILNRMVYVLEKLGCYNETSIYDLKLHLIEECIYGIDIQSIAVQISKLRFFISLVVEQQEIDLTKPEENYKVITLPNLETKFVSANTLIGLKASNKNMLDLNDKVLEEMKTKLWEVRRQHFYAKSANQKKTLRIEDENLRDEIKTYVSANASKPNITYLQKLENEIIQLKNKREDFIGELWVDETEIHSQVSMFDIQAKNPSMFRVDKNLEERAKVDAHIKVIYAEIAKENNKTLNVGFEKEIETIANWNPYDQNASSPFFDVEWMFGLKSEAEKQGCFDLVIGNPPYLRIQGIREANPEFANFLTKEFVSASGSFDLYTVFLEKALSLVNKHGIANYIMPTKWTNASFGAGLRQVVSNKKSACKIINFGSYQVFNASTYTGLQWFKQGSDSLLYFGLDRDLKSNEDLSLYLSSLTDKDATLIPNHKLNKDIWTLTDKAKSKIIEKLNLQPKRISDIFEKIFQGLATSKDDVYFLYDCTFDNNLVNGFSKQLDRIISIEMDFTKPLLKGDGVHRYEDIKTNKVVVFPYKLTNGNADLYTENEIKSRFPLGYSYLKECEDVLRDREKGRLKTDSFWYRYIYPKNLTLFCKEKLVAPEISLGGNFSYDEKGEFYSTTKVYGYIKKENIKESYFFWLGLFNSNLFWYFIKQTGYVLRGGYYTFKTNYILPFPVSGDISVETHLAIENLVKEILMKKNRQSEESTNIQEKEIDNYIYELYQLTTQEISIVEDNALL
ncbi:hypothetical protein EZ449_21300 [Pedobacter frigidisoli]|uniref:site-specific DNA-methyltransferase (adenine-specific) n=1 Tax=Pedobacter frigidisoli TaxID=2530455 RepID=A0A4R0NGT1_9SPHI|nr:Eco57I restriction-modification methylase domain-containing protein [Pedobacter frigidisoli]TCC99751.1 hypothetical protein EZ449_21300 [Pedobacter frigidisoli]